MWSQVIYTAGNKSIPEASPDPEKYFKIFTNPIAQGLFADFQRLNVLLKLTDKLPDNFSSPEDKGKSFWLDYTSHIPDKFIRLNLYIRQYENLFRTCIITDKEIDTFVQMDLDYLKGSIPGSWQGSIKDRNRFSLELNYLIPAQLKKIGYEIIRLEEAEEISMPMIRKLARAIHSKYLNEMRHQITHGNNNQLNADFEELPDNIKYSNIDNALNIPTKLLSIGYKIRQVKKGFKPVTLHLNDTEIETMARVEHMRWSWEKRLSGWTLGNIRDEDIKTHPSLVPYEELSESEKEKDRELVKLIPALLQDIDYEAYPVSPNRIKKLSYAIKPQGIIQKILDEIRELNDQIRELVTLTSSTEEMVRIRNTKIVEAISEVEQSYKYALHIQETFLPDDLFVRECFSDSFVLHKPKDIVSGDFYFFSRKDHLKIFAAADCTGHGIPGALLSTLGYGILDQAVNEIKLTDPSYILYHLYSRIHRFLRSDEADSGLSDDMDIILCILDITTNILSYAGVKNPLYHIANGELIEYRANNSAEECNTDGECLFTSEKISLNAGDTIYLCSDGYIDQFGGTNHKKFQSSRLKKLLKSIHRLPMPEQSDLLYEEIELWRDENHEDQVDDILVIGIRI
jgi:serine phosphatase RsbU (regulator of sigma subunit)